jgi:ankyrin repeat protein
MKTNLEIKMAIDAAKSADQKQLNQLIKKSPALALDPRVLSTATLHGQYKIVQLLLKAGADPNEEVISHEHYRPLHRAVEHRGVPKNPGHLESARLLVQHGADLQARATWMSITPLAVAGMTGDKEFIELILSQGVPVDIYTAVILADVKRVGTLLKAKPKLAKEKDVNRMTPLHYAALSGLREDGDQKNLRQICAKLLELGADPDAKGDIGPYPQTPVLHFAPWNDHFAVAETLLKAGANPNLGFSNCLWREPKRMAELFLSFGADVNIEESPGVPLLHSRIHWNLPAVCLWLLKNGANPNVKGKGGDTALHIAARKGINPKVIEALVERGGNLRAKNDLGDTPLDIARKAGKKSIPLFLT